MMSSIQQFYQDCFVKFALMGHNPAHLHRCPAVWNMERSTPSSDMMIAPALLCTAGIVSRTCMAGSYFSEYSVIRCSTSSITLSQFSLTLTRFVRNILSCSESFPATVSLTSETLPRSVPLRHSPTSRSSSAPFSQSRLTSSVPLIPKMSERIVDSLKPHYWRCFSMRFLWPTISLMRTSLYRVQSRSSRISFGGM